MKNDINIPCNDGSKPDECALITQLAARRLARPIAVLADKLGISANTVTVVAGLSWIISLTTAPIAGALFDHESGGGLGRLLWFVSGFLWNTGYILDVADGSLARITMTSSRRGFYLDYVFHLLFKPAFLASVGIGLYLCGPVNPTNTAILLLAILSIPANWSASASAVEHVLCEEIGKRKLTPYFADEHGLRRLWLGTTDMNETASSKRTSVISALTTFAKEIFSYYAQFVFFSITVMADILIHFPASFPAMPVTRLSFIVLSTAMIVRTPFRVIREYLRIAAADEQ